MHYADIKRIARIPDSHPYVSEISIDPADHRRLTGMVEGRPELKILGVDSRQADEWTIFVGCASRRVRAEFDDWVQNIL